MNHFKVYSIILLSSFFSISCQQEKKTPLELEIEKALPELEAKAGQFVSSQNIDPEFSHRAVLVQQNPDGGYQVQSIGPMRKGVLPHLIEREQTKNITDFKVIWKNVDGKFLGAYSIEHPLNLRTCEGGESTVKRSEQTQFELLIPSDKSILGIEIMENGKSVSQLNLRKFTQKE